VITLNIGIVGDYHPHYPSHEATQASLLHSARHLDVHVEYEWLATEQLPAKLDASTYDGFWIAPGAHASISGILHVIRLARQNNIPLLGTCGGFQHMLMEYARNKLLLSDAEYEEFAPDATDPFISRLACSLAGKQGEVLIHSDSQAHDIYQADATIEHFRCSYGLNPAYLPAIQQSELRITGTDAHGEPRIIELPHHHFYIGTLFVPQLASSYEAPHRLITAFLEHAQYAV